MENNTGTITWFEIAKDGLPPIGKGEWEQNQRYSDRVLVSIENSREDWLIGKGIAVHTQHIAGGLWSHDAGNWTPTHWAYINYP